LPGHDRAADQHAQENPPMIVEPRVFTCSICGEPSTDICAYCTKDTCTNHRCTRCKRCSDCCECEVPLSAAEPEVEPAIEPEAAPALAPEAEHAIAPAVEPDAEPDAEPAIEPELLVNRSEFGASETPAAAESPDPDREL